MEQRRFRSFGPHVLVVACLLWVREAAADVRAEAAVARAATLGLSNTVAWWRLLHYRSSAFGIRSQVDGSAFFLSEQGRYDPEAELSATLRAFYAPVAGARPDAHARCRFPARFQWLDRKLALSRDLPPLRCPKLERFTARVTPERITLVYAANNVESPVSAFGHTFLRFHRKSGDLSVEYKAETDTDNPLWYAFKGLVGLFEGRFHVESLNSKLIEYLDGELRDVWEYELLLSSDEQGQIVRHLWELAPTYFDYYYMTENCSYGVLGLLEAGAPRLELIERTKYVVSPVDTLKAVWETPGLVGDVRFRPAEVSPNAPNGAERDPLPAARTPWQQAPHAGHGSMRIVLGTGFTSQYDDGFATLGYRIALHDLADPPRGQPALSQIQFMDTKLRYELERRRLTLNELTFAELMALHPLGTRPAPSWRARGYGKRLHDAGCENEDCFAHGINGSLGLSLGTSNLRAVVFLLADAYVLLSGELDGIDGSFVRAGVGPFGGFRLHGPGQLVAEATGSWSYLPGQELTGTYELNATLRVGLAKNVALGSELKLQPSATEAQLASYLYF